MVPVRRSFVFFRALSSFAVVAVLPFAPPRRRCFVSSLPPFSCNVGLVVAFVLLWLPSSLFVCCLLPRPSPVCFVPGKP